MQAERFRQIRNLFDAAMEREPQTRPAFLQEACHGDEDLLVEVGRLLAAQGEPTGWIDEGLLGQQPQRLEGRRIGPYEILRQLGEGGMGSVYLAARVDGAFRKLVALKIVRPAAASGETLQRFQREREILALLDHPNIARILDGGTTADGLPYLVMDYVEGEPIDTYCDRHRLDLDARLKLFREVCSAVQYAHDHHVIHRDLKPNNILVTGDGVVKLLDFGIAKLGTPELDGATLLTRTNLCLMTPEYASPEQVTGGAPTAATDVYSLGVVLYELLTGRRPYRMRSRMLHEVVRVICEEPPARPSTAVTETETGKDGQEQRISVEAVSRVRAASPEELKRQLSGDLDCILLKALDKDPPRRYQSARGFSEDLRLHLEGVDIEARQGELARAAGQFMGRNVWLLIAAAAASLTVYNQVLPAGAVISLGLVTLFTVSVYGASRYIFGKDIVRHKAPRIAKGAVIGILTLIAAASILPRLLPASENPFLVFEVAILAVWNAYVFSRAVAWLRRGRRLGPLLHNLSQRGASFRRQTSPEAALRAFRLGLWFLVPMILFMIWGGLGFFRYGHWYFGSVLLLLAIFLALYLWMGADPVSRESVLTRPSRLGLAVVILYLLSLTAFVSEHWAPVYFPGRSPEGLYQQLFGNWLGLSFGYLLVLWTIPPLLISGRNEIRELGLAWSGRLIRWEDVLSYSWAEDTGLVEVLSLRIKRGSRSSRELRIPMLPNHRTAVDSILNRQFSEWPSARG